MPLFPSPIRLLGKLQGISALSRRLDVPRTTRRAPNRQPRQESNHPPALPKKKAPPTTASPRRAPSSLCTIRRPCSPNQSLSITPLPRFSFLSTRKPGPPTTRRQHKVSAHAMAGGKRSPLTRGNGKFEANFYLGARRRNEWKTREGRQQHRRARTEESGKARGTRKEASETSAIARTSPIAEPSSSSEVPKIPQCSCVTGMRLTPRAEPLLCKTLRNFPQLQGEELCQPAHFLVVLLQHMHQAKPRLASKSPI